VKQRSFGERLENSETRRLAHVDPNSPVPQVHVVRSSSGYGHGTGFASFVMLRKSPGFALVMATIFGGLATQ
jgi:hypothetical protein